MKETINHLAEGYVTSQIEYDGHNGPLIDLGLGKSPIGAAPELKQILAKRDPLEDLVDYDQDPYHTQTRSLIAAATKVPEITSSSIVLNGNGSYGAGDEVVRYLALSGMKRILVPNCSFPNVAQWAIRHGIDYSPISGGESPLFQNPVSSQLRILEMPSNQLSDSIVYVDYPNNPFGISVYPLTREVIHHVTQSGGTPIIDLAFGEVLGNEYYQILKDTYTAGGICLGSLTKTQGLAKLRTGWAILPEHLTSNGYSGAQRLVFGINQEADLACNILFNPQSDTTLAEIHAQRVAQYNRVTNSQLYSALEELGVTVMPSNLETSIQIVASQMPDFYTRLMAQGIKTESLLDYSGTLNTPGLGHQAVRLLTPPPGKIDEVISRIKQAIS